MSGSVQRTPAPLGPAGGDRKRRLWTLALLVSLCVQIPSLAAGQVDASAAGREAAADAAEDAQKLTPVPANPGTAVTLVLDRIEHWQTEVGRLGAALETDQPVEALAARTQASQQELDQELGELDVTLAERPDVPHLRELRSAWRGRTQDLHATGQDVDAALNRAGKRLARVNELLEAADSQVNRAPASEDAVLRQRLDAVAQRVEDLRVRHAVYQRELTRLRVTHDEQLARAENAVMRIEDLLQAQESHVLARDAPALWRTAVQPSHIAGARARWHEVVGLTREYAGRHQSELFWQAILLIGLWVALTRAQKNRPKVSVPQRQERAVDATLRRPRATAVLLALAITPLMYIPGTELMGLGMTFVVLATAAFILVSVRTAPLPWSLALPLVTLPLDAMRSLLQSGTALSRATLAFELTLLAAAAWRLSRSANLEEATLMCPAQGTRPALRGLSLVSLGLAAGEVLGFSQLAELIGSGLLKATYLSAAYATTYGSAIGALAVLLSSERALRLKLIARRPHDVMQRARVLAMLVLGSGWFITVLGVFGAREGAWQMATWLWNETWELGAIAISVGDVLGFGVVLLLSFELSKATHYLLEDDVLPALRLPRGVPYAIATLARYAMVVVGFFIALGAAGIDLSHLSVMLGALGVGIGFGLQTVVNNWVSGLILLFERPIQVGDTVEVSGVSGTIAHIGIRSTTILTFSGAEVLVPNSELVSLHLTNWTLTDRKRRIEMPVGVAYGTDPELVLQLLRDCVTHNVDVLTSPEPAVLFTGFGNSSLDFEVRVWVSGDGDWLATRTEVLVAIRRALSEAEIEIPFPQRDLHLRSIDPSVSWGQPRGESATAQGQSPHLPDD